MIGEIPGIPAGLKDSLLFHLEAVIRIVNRRAEALLQETPELGVRESLIIQAARVTSRIAWASTATSWSSKSTAWTIRRVPGT